MSDTAILDIKQEVARLLELDATLQSHNVKIYPGRVIKQEYYREIMVFSNGTDPSRSGGSGLGTKSQLGEYDVAVFWAIAYDAEGVNNILAMDDLSDTFEQAIYRIILKENPRTNVWNRVETVGKSIRPPAPGGTQNLHYGRIVFRIRAMN